MRKRRRKSLRFAVSDAAVCLSQDLQSVRVPLPAYAALYDYCELTHDQRHPVAVSLVQWPGPFLSVCLFAHR